jgi:hypothetical protein
MEGNYANDEVRSLEDIWWPAECIHNVHTFIRRNERKKMGRKRKRGEKRREGSVVFPWRKPWAHLFFKIPLLLLTLGGILWKKKERAMSNPLKV